MADGPDYYPIHSLSRSGLLWRINRVIFHPDGFALLEAPPEARVPFYLKGWHNTPLDYCELDRTVEDQAWRTFRTTLLDAERHNKPARRIDRSAVRFPPGMAKPTVG